MSVPDVQENTPVETVSQSETQSSNPLDENGIYDTKEQVAEYIQTYGRLPKNYMTKKEARKRYGWKGGPLHEYEDNLCIGGDVFSNFEGTLPEKEGQTYYECDIGTLSSDSRGAKRIVYSNDGLIYYTSDHYQSFELLAGDESS
ncbi:MAG: ribonuclease [Erysipelotrichaceae bacterium]|nr:ribonuclease [Erysipelotrichaceae bacterium]